MLGKMIMHIGRIQPKQGFGCWQVQFVSYCKHVNSKWVWGKSAQPQKNFAIYTFIYAWKQCFQLLTDTKLLPTLQHKYFCLKAGNLIINWLLLSYTTCRTERLSSLFDNKYEGKGASKIPIFQHFSELGKNQQCSLGFSKILIYHFDKLGKTWKYNHPKTNISKSKFG